jgi:hypothetical protein
MLEKKMIGRATKTHRTAKPMQVSLATRGGRIVRDIEGSEPAKKSHNGSGLKKTTGAKRNRVKSPRAGAARMSKGGQTRTAAKRTTKKASGVAKSRTSPRTSRTSAKRKSGRSKK